MKVTELLFIDKVKNNRQAFGEAVIKYASKLGFNPDWIMFIINTETQGTFRPDIQNKTTKATGLIQFLPSTAESLDTTVDMLKEMTNVEQLSYVYKYFKQWAYLKPKVLHDVTLITFYPYAIKKGLQYVIGSEKGEEKARKIAKQNPIFDHDKNGLITKQDYINAINSLIDQHVKDKSKAEKLKMKLPAAPKKNVVQKSIFYQAFSDLLI